MWGGVGRGILTFLTMLLTLFGIGKMNIVAAQSCGTGTFYQLDTIHWAALGQPVPPVRFFDSKGKEYSAQSIVIPPGLTSCDAGMFEVFFQDSGGDPFFYDNTPNPNGIGTMGELRQNLACRVFQDLSDFLFDVNPANNARVNIRINAVPLMSIALANPIYEVVTSISTISNLVLDNECYQTILSGQDSYLQYPNFISGGGNMNNLHAGIELNPYINDPNLDWHYDILTVPTMAGPDNNLITGNIDYYTVLLHEALHLLGITNAETPNNNFSRLEKFIVDNNPPILTPYILQNAANSGIWDLNPLTVPFNNNCGTPSTKLFDYVAVNQQETYFNIHLSCENNIVNYGPPNDFVMAPITILGDEKRHPNEVEKNILCDLGYSFTPYTTGLPEWGNGSTNPLMHHLYTSPCAPPCNIVSISDIYDIQCIPSILHITPLVNDLNVSSNTVLSQIRILTPNANAGTIVNLTTTSFDFIPAPGLPNGWVMLSYVPVCGNGQDGGTAYIFINIQNNPLTISKTVTNTSITLGGVIDYEIIVCNPCTEGNVNGVVIEDVLDIDNFNLLSVQTTDFGINGNVLTTPPMNLAPGCTTLHFSVNNSGCETTTFTNTAAIMEVNGNAIPPISSTVNTGWTIGQGYDLLIPYLDGTEEFSDWVSFFPVLPNNTVYTVRIDAGNTLFINMPYHFQNIVFIMEHDSEITILDNAPTEMTDCLLQGCNYLWRGIKVAESAQFQLHHSIVKDAEYGIFINDLAKVLVDANSLFRNNYIGICVGESANTLFNSLTLTVENTIFEGAGNLLPSFSTPITPIYNEALAGMYLNDLMFSMNNNVEFRHLSNGILGHNCELTLSKIRFKDIHDFPSSPYHTVQDGTTGLLWNGGNPVHFNGSAVLNVGHNMIAGLTMTGAGSGTLPNGFDDCDYGIVTHGCRLTAKNNTMLNMGLGIYTFRNDKQRIENNSIHARFAGVLSQWADYSPTDIAGNYIEIHNPTGGSGSIGIGILNWLGAFATNINGNNIFTGLAGRGIFVLNGSYIKVFDQSSPGIVMNQLPNSLVPPPFNAYGIFVQNTSNGYFGCNRVSGASAGNGANAYSGLYFQDSPENTISCNVTDETTKGLEFRGDCHAENKVIGNEMQDHFWGMYINPSSFIDQQDHTGNKWTATGGIYGSTYGAENLGTVFPFFIDGANPIFYPSVNPSNWFIQVVGQDIGCSATECGGNANLIGESLKGFDYLTANDSIIDSLYQEELQYGANRYLYEKLDEIPNLLPETGIIHDFYNDNANNSIGKFTEIEQDQQAIQENLLVTQLHSIQESIENIKEQLRLSDSLFVATNDSSILQTSDSLNIAMQNLQAQNISVSEQVNAYQTTQASIIDNKNSTVVANALYESNEKQINEIYLNTIAKQDYHFNQYQISIIDDIAHQCPFTGGKGIYKARALYALFYPFEVYDDKDICAAQNINWRKHNPITFCKDNINIYPNPAFNLIQIDFAAKSEADKQFSLYDILGREILSHTILASETTAKITVGKLSKGIYQVRITSDKQVTFTTKLIIE